MSRKLNTETVTSTVDVGGPMQVHWCWASHVAPESSLLVAVELRLDPAVEVAAELRLESAAALTTLGTATFGFGFALGLEPDL